MAELTWDDIVGMLRGYSVFWETRDVTLSPWCGDPDGGELRIALALRDLAVAAATRGPDAALSTETIRRMLADRLARDLPEVIVERREL
jgi:hypothetical protein